jgi:hypothetical protein
MQSQPKEANPTPTANPNVIEIDASKESLEQMRIKTID